ncbi:rubredoxin-like domain-containing protein, partial [Alistipes ihumii]
FAMIAEIERTHMERFRGLYDTMKDGHIFVKEEDTVWRCMECGHIYIGKKAPNRCPVCQHPQALFEIKCDRY